MAQETNSGFSHSKGRLTLFSFASLLLISVVICLIMILPYLLSLFVGAFLALLAYPLRQKLEGRCVGASLASAIVTIGIVVLVITPVAIFITLAVQQGIVIVDAISDGKHFSIRSFFNYISHLPAIRFIFGLESGFEEQLRAWISEFGKTISAVVWTMVANVPDILLQLAIISISCFFFLADGEKFVLWMRDKIPLDKDVRTKLFASFRESASSVFWSTVAAAGVQSVIMFLAFLILSVPAATFAAGATFILAWIPIVGSTPVWLGGAFYLYFFQGSLLKAGLMLGFGAIAGLSDNFVRPAILKGRQNMHPLVSLIAIFGGIAMFGIMGVFIGPILAAAMIVLLQIWPVVAHRFGLMPARSKTEG